MSQQTSLRRILPPFSASVMRRVNYELNSPALVVVLLHPPRLSLSFDVCCIVILAFGPTTTSSADSKSFACGHCISDMDVQDAQRLLSEYLQELANLFHRLPGSAIFLRYVKSSYQDDPIRSAVELFLFLFAVRYLLAPKYSTKPGVVKLSEDEIDDLVDEWTPEPLVGEPSAVEEMEVDKRTVIVGYGKPFWSQSSLC